MAVVKLPEDPSPVPAGAGGDVGHAGDFQVRVGDAGHAQRFADNGVLHLCHVADLLHLRVLDDQPRLESLVERDVDVLVDGGSDQKTAVFLVIRRQVGPTATQADAQWTTCDNHDVLRKPMPGNGNSTHCIGIPPLAASQIGQATLAQ
jgi:hypothetical protein